MILDNPQPRELWWIKPDTLIISIILPIYISIGLYENLSSNINYIFSGCLIFLLYLGVLISLRTPSTHTNLAYTPSQKNSKLLLNSLFAISTLGYFIWFIDIIKNPAILLAALSEGGKIFSLRGLIETTPGLSTLSQIAVLYSALFAKIKATKNQLLPRRFTIYFITLLAFVIFRSWVWNERLALLEYICPAITIYLYSKRTNVRTHRLASMLPIVGAIFIYTIFSLFEFFRSWQYYSKEQSNFFSFTFYRLIKYYSTSVKNGVEFLSWQSSPTYDGSMLFTSIYRLPYISELTTDASAKNTFHQFLSCCADDEFNLASWPFLITSDIGPLLSTIFFFSIGLLIGKSYLNFRSSKASFIYYPVLYISLLELLRQHYIHGPRFIYIILGASIVHLALKTRKFRTPISGTIRTS